MTETAPTPEASPPSASSGRPTVGKAVSYGLMPVLALALTVALESGERQSLAQAVDGIQSEFSVSDDAIGALAAAMAVIGTVGSIPIGMLADRLRRTRLLGGAMGVWTGGMVLSGIAPGYNSLFAARLSVGAVEGNGPAAVSLLADYYPVRKRAKMFGLYQSGALVGGLVGLVAGGFVVDAHGWRWAFWMWVPAGVAVATYMWTRPEPERGGQDDDLATADVSDDAGPLAAGPLSPEAAGLVDEETAVDVLDALDLPPPDRVGTLDYRSATWRQVIGELWRIRSMWLAVVALTLSNFLLAGLQFWGVEFFKREHDLSAGGAGLYTGLFGLGAAVGVLGGGFVSDRYLRRGVVNARIYVVSAASVVASIVLAPAFLVGNLAAAAPLFVIGGAALTMPVAPGEAMMNDVVVAPLRGRAGSVRSVCRSVGALSPLVIGVLSEAFGLATALVVVTPAYAVGGIVVLLAARTYGGDLAFVAAETERIRALRDTSAADPRPGDPDGTP